jgi:hypothetical protein
MRTTSRSTFLLLAVLVSSPVGAAGPTPSEELLTAAIEAAGGETNLAKAANVSLKAKGFFLEDEEEGAPFTLEWTQTGLDRGRSLSLTGEGDTQKRILTVVNGKTGWSKEGDDPTRVLEPDELKSERESLHLGWVTNLAPLKGKAYRLQVGKPAKVNDKDAVVLKVAREGYADITLYFDKETRLLVKSERRCPHPDNGADTTEEAFYDDYKEVQGVQFPMRTSIKYDEKTYSKTEVTEVKFPEKPDAKLFDKP